MPTTLKRDLAQAPDAGTWRKRALRVHVEFARADGVLATLEGPVRYDAGDALLTGSAGERWPVRRATFDARYVVDTPATPAAVTMQHGDDGAYRKLPQDVRALQVADAFAVRLPDGQLLQGQPGDWLVEYGPGDQAIVAAAIFSATYERV